DFAFDVDRDLFGQIAVGDSRGNGGDVAHLVGQAGGHEIDVVGQVFPRAGQPTNVGLATEFSFGAYLAGHTRHFRREGAKLIDHRVDGVFEFENFPFDVDGDLLGQVTVGHGGRHGGDVTDLTRQVP